MRVTGRADLAALASLLLDRLRAAGVAADPLGASALAAALPGVLADPGDRRSRLYWTGRITLVRDARDFDAYDRVFEDLVGVRADPPPAPDTPSVCRPRRRADAAHQAGPGAGTEAETAEGAAWVARPRRTAAGHRAELDAGLAAETGGDVPWVKRARGRSADHQSEPDAAPMAGTAGEVPWVKRARRAAGGHRAELDTGRVVETAGEVPRATDPRHPATERTDGREVPVLVPAPGREPRAEAVPFGDLDDQALADLAAQLRAAAHQRPRRRTRRFEVGVGGRGRLDLRRTAHRWRRTGGEPLQLVRVRQRRRPRRLVVLCDVSESMQPYVTAFLHLMRAASMDNGETFAFGTSLGRLSPALRRRTPAEAVAAATALVGDRYGGTRIAASLRTLLRSHHGELLRGAVVVVASDGWDTDPPQQLAAQMARIARRAHRVVWVNPRAGEPGYRPLAGGMAAALPYCDAVVSAATLAELPQIIDALSSTASRRRRDGTS